MIDPDENRCEAVSLWKRCQLDAGHSGRHEVNELGCRAWWANGYDTRPAAALGSSR